MDSFLLGCIPVFFMTEYAFSRFLPAHLAVCGRNASVVLPPEPFLSCEIDAFAHLRAISPARIRRMQAVIRRHAQRLVYGLDHVQGDALDVLVNTMLQRTHAQLKKKPRLSV